MKDELISVIVPIYNVENYLKISIPSIINQTYKNLEIILIDDGSSDNSSKICDEYALVDNRIKVIHQKNVGVSITRNNGIKVSKGNYICFIDSDDYVLNNYIEYLYNILKETNSDLSQCNYYEVYDCKYKRINLNNKIITYTGKEAIIDMLYERNMNSSLWGKLIKKELFTNLSFNNSYKKFEDYDIIHKIYNNSSKIVYGNQPKYYYFIRNNSLMNEKFSENNLAILSIIDDMFKYYQNCNEDLYNALIHRKLCAYFYIIRSCDHKSNIYLKTKNNIKLIRKRVLKDHKASKKSKIGIILSFFSFRFVKMMFIINKKYVSMKTKLFGNKIDCW